MKPIAILICSLMLSGCAMFNTVDKRLTNAIKAMDDNLSVECRAGIIEGIMASSTITAEKKLAIEAIHKYLTITDEYRKCYTLGATICLTGEMAEDGIAKLIQLVK